MSPRAAAGLVWSVCGLTLALIVCAIVLASLNSSEVVAVSFPLALTASALVGGGAVFDGPAIVVEMDSTTVLHPGSPISVDRYGNLLLGPNQVSA